MADLMAGKDEEEDEKRPTHSPGVDHVFNGGLPCVGAILLSAMEGTGKTTWLWGLLHKLAVEQGRRSLYCSSEQSPSALRRQFERLELSPSKDMIIVSQPDRDGIISIIEKEEPEIVVLDSLHEVENITDESGFSMASGTGPAVTRVAKEIRRLSEELKFFAFLVGHMNNDGTMAGSAHLRHAVDGTLEISRSGDKRDPKRFLHFAKCRFAPTDRQALFLMGDRGMVDKGPFYEREDGRSPEDLGDDGNPKRRRGQLN